MIFYNYSSAYSKHLMGKIQHHLAHKYQTRVVTLGFFIATTANVWLINLRCANQKRPSKSKTSNKTYPSISECTLKSVKYWFLRWLFASIKKKFQRSYRFWIYILWATNTKKFMMRKMSWVPFLLAIWTNRFAFWCAFFGLSLGCSDAAQNHN